MSKIKTGIKIRVTPEQSRKVQEICFENDISWGNKRKQITHEKEPYLFIDKYITYMAKYEERDFCNTPNKEVSAELFIRSNGACIEADSIKD